MIALKMMIMVRMEVDGIPADRLASGWDSGLGDEETRLLIAGLLGDLAAARAATARGLVTVDNVTALLCAVVKEQSLSDRQIDELLAMAEDGTDEFLAYGDMLRPATRGVNIGPWDVTEAHRGGESIELGAIRIPAGEGMEIRPVHAADGSGDLLGVTAVSGSTAIKLQAFHAVEGCSWETVRGELLATVHANGGTAAEWAGAAGVELRAGVPVRTPDHSRKVMQVRFLGCDGPGWLLRGDISGTGAAPDSTDLWAYEMFSGTVVAPPQDFQSGSTDDTAITLRWPQSPQPGGRPGS
ncbi:DUF3710 domain-containing protein [Streptomyces sp. H27-D2]|uniref:DUF3710 domain-containing protein n=1 Tax=Streptomyces sp. H27-D2 TaxID=3046304 RepID=UPI002DBF22FB|nr:DUF3710 domain-containing protein [Streptomyces sp. H27-D2]MEC4020975.1 DUF3710 domain-containing protein [Streptomyces sp. H27-D2]